jgi:hypothetical protein
MSNAITACLQVENGTLVSTNSLKRGIKEKVSFGIPRVRVKNRNPELKWSRNVSEA